MFSGMSHEQLLKKLSGPPQGYVVAGDPCLNATGLVGSSNSATQGHSKYNIGTYQPNMDVSNLLHTVIPEDFIVGQNLILETIPFLFPKIFYFASWNYCLISAGSHGVGPCLG